MATNTGIPYEKLTQHIFDQILNRDRVDTINVEHNIDSQGMTTNHQIDVSVLPKLPSSEHNSQPRHHHLANIHRNHLESTQ